MPGSGDSPIPDPMAWLSFVGATTTTLGLGTGILILPQRNPSVLAKEVATVDALTEGRVMLGDEVLAAGHAFGVAGGYRLGFGQGLVDDLLVLFGFLGHRK